MRLLHTADWHLGKLLKGVDRTPEIAAALRDLLGLVRSERVDLVVVSGDLFDRPQVSAEAEACAVEFFMELKALGVPALVIAGNHGPRQRWLPFGGAPSDGVVAVDETRLPGVPHVEVRALHTFLMNDARVARLVNDFLAHGDAAALVASR